MKRVKSSTQKRKNARTRHSRTQTHELLLLLLLLLLLFNQLLADFLEDHNNLISTTCGYAPSSSFKQQQSPGPADEGHLARNVFAGPGECCLNEEEGA